MIIDIVPFSQSSTVLFGNWGCLPVVFSVRDLFDDWKKGMGTSRQSTLSRLYPSADFPDILPLPYSAMRLEPSSALCVREDVFILRLSSTDRQNL